MRNLKFDWFYFKDDEDPKILISLDWYKYDDRWNQCYMLGRPMYSPEDVERKKIKNRARCRWFRITASILGLRLNLDIKIKHIGNLLHGRIFDEEEEAQKWRDRIAKHKTRRSTNEERN